MVPHVQVIKEELAGPDFVWMLPGWYKARWWAEVNDTNSTCTAEEMCKALEHTLGGRGHDIFDYNSSRVLVSNKVWQYNT